MGSENNVFICIMPHRVSYLASSLGVCNAAAVVSYLYYVSKHIITL